MLHKKDTHIIVPYQNRTPQEIISRLKTKLTILEIKEPSLEDAYVDYINKTGWCGSMNEILLTNRKTEDQEPDGKSTPLSLSH